MNSQINIDRTASRFLNWRSLPLGLLALAVLILYLSLTGIAPAGAQSDTILVSNTEQFQFGGDGWQIADTPVAHGFMTGSNANGYIITGIGLDVRSASATRGTVVEIRSAVTGPIPAQTALAILSNPPDLADGTREVKTFTTSTPLILASNTRYYVVISCVEGSGVCLTMEQGSRNTEDDGAATGWNIDDGGSRQHPSWASVEGQRKVYFNVQGKLLDKPLGEITASASATNSGSNSLKIIWTAYAGAATYEVQWKSGEEAFSGTRSSGNELTGTEYTITNLTAGKAYRARVRAYDSTDNLIAQSSDFGAVIGLTLNVVSRTEIIVFWSTYEGADEYTLKWKPDDMIQTVETPDTGSIVRYEITGLTKSTEYTVTVEVNDHADGVIATAEGTATTYGDVTGITATAGVNSLQISWDATPGAASYRVDVREPGAREDAGATTLTSATSATTIGLKSGTQYEVEIFALSADDADTITTGSAIFTTMPGTIADLSLTPETRHTILVFWKPFERAASYTVKWQQGSQEAQSETVDPPSAVGTIRYTIRELTKNTEYTVTVEAKDGSGTVIASTQRKATTYNDVTGITVTAGVNYLRTSWDATPDATQYRVDVRIPDAPEDSGVTTLSRRSAITTGLESGTQYKVTVEAQGEGGYTITTGSTTGTTLVTRDGSRDSSKDFNTLNAAGNGLPQGLWSDGTTMWVGDSFDDKIYAYSLSTKARDSAKDFNSLAGGDIKRPYGIWSDGATMWVADYFAEKIFAYSMSSKARDSSKDFNTLRAAGNREPYGIWSDGTTMWVADFGDEKLYAYSMSTKARDSAKDFDTLKAASNGAPRGLWSDGTTMWVVDVDDNKIYAYNLDTKARDSAKDINGLAGAGNDRPWGIWSNGHTIWVSDTTDKKLYAYRLPTRAPTAPTGLTAMTGGVTVIDLSWTDGGAGTAAAATSYYIEVSTDAGRSWSDLVSNTMSTDTTHSHTGINASTTRHYRVSAINAAGTSSASNIASATTNAPTTVTGTPTGLMATANGQTQVDLSWTAPEPTATGGNATGYRIQVSTDRGTSWTDLVADTMSTATTYSHTGLSPGTERHYRVFAINTVGTSGPSNTASATPAWFTRDNTKDLALHADNGDPGHIWSDGTTMWVTDYDDDKLYAYTLSGGARDSAKDITLAAGNDIPQGIYSDGTTIWVAQFGFDGTPKIFAYTLSDGARDSARDFNTLNSAGNEQPHGLWSNGITMWVSDSNDKKIYAYNLGTKARDSTEDFNTLQSAGNEQPFGIWSDGTTMWVADATNNKLYAYNLSTKARDSVRDNDTLVAVGNDDPVGIWSNGNTMWVMDQSDAKLDAYIPPPPPGAPTGLTATAAGPTEIDLSWTAPAPTDTGATAASYRIEVSADGGTTWTRLVANTNSEATTYSHTKVPSGATRHYRVSAINSGIGSPSNTASATTSAPTTVPNAPTGLTATAGGTTKINLSWTAPSGAIPSGVKGYTIDIELNSDWVRLEGDTGNTDTTYSHTGLTPGTERSYRVFAINDIGRSEASNVAMATTHSGVPTDLTATANGQTQIQLEWTAPASTQEEAPTAYRIEVSFTGEDGSWTDLVTNTQSTDTTYTHRELTQETKRYYRVRAIGITESGPSNVAHATTDSLHPPTGLTATAKGETRIDLEWTAPTVTVADDATTGYQIEVSETGEDDTWTVLVINTGNTKTTYSHEDVAPGTTQHYRVRTVNANGTSEPSPTASAKTLKASTTVPGPPTGLRATANGQTQIDLSWTAPTKTDTRGAATGYRIEISPSGKRGTWATRVADTGSLDTTYSHTGLTSRETWYYRVSAVNGFGAGSPSSVATATTIHAGPVRVEELGGALRVNWDEAKTGIINGYAVEWKSGGQNFDRHSSRYANLTYTARSYTITGLTPGREYGIRVRPIGYNEPVYPPVTATPLDDKVTGLTAKASSETALQVDWTDVPGATGYTVQWFAIGDGPWSTERQATTTGTSHTITGLTTGTRHVIRVQAQLIGGASGTWSNNALGIPSATSELPPVTNLTAEAISATRFTVNWSAVSGANSYTVQWNNWKAGQRWREAEQSASVTETTHTITVPASNKTEGWAIRVRPEDTDGTTGPWGIIHADQKEVTGPTALTATAKNSGEVDLAWTAATTNRVISGYLVQWRSASGRDKGELKTGGTSTTATVTGLRPDTTYNFDVSAVFSNQDSSSTTTDTATTEASTGKPGKPTNLMARAINEAWVALTWEPATGQGVTGYAIEISPNGTDGWTSVEQDTGSTLPRYNHSGLAPETTYYYRVLGGNSRGTSGWSDIASTTTDVPAPQQQQSEPPNRAPKFDANVVTTLAVPENSPGGTNVGSPITATDPDQGDTLIYSLSGTDASSFRIGESTGQITTRSDVTYDYESKSSYSLVVDITDGKSGLNSTPVTINLTDVNETPVFGEGTADETGLMFTTRQVAENSPAGTRVGLPVDVTDPDAGDTLTYLLTGTDATSFSIDQQGQITTVPGMTYDYETKSSYEIVIAVTDSGGRLNAIGVTVSLTDVDEDSPTDQGSSPQQSEPAQNLPPEFHEGDTATREVAENSPAGTNVGAPITATDPDEDALTYSLSGTDAASFSIDSTGQITTVANVTYDYETKSAYSLAVDVSDGNGGTASIAVTVNLNDVLECHNEAGTLSETASLEGNWDAADCKAHHQDSRARYFHFTLEAEAEVTITLSAGTLYVSGDTPNNGWGTAAGGGYEHRIKTRKGNGKLLHDGSSSAATLTLPAGSYTAETAQTTDSGDSFTLEIGLSEPASTEDSNAEPEPPANQAPNLDANIVTTLSVAENSPAGTNVGSPITATDPDEGDTLTYSLSGTDAASFAIGSTTGQITTKTGVTYDYESSKKSYSLAVDVSDGKGGQISTPVTVNLTNVNEAPVFSEGASATREVAENSAAGTNVGAAIAATDPDSDTLTYSMTGTDAASFDIGSTTGQLTTKSGVTYDFETKKSYSVTVAAEDPSHAIATIAVTINLTNVDETPVQEPEPEPANQAPSFTEGASATREVAENSAAGTNVGTAVTATDPDDGDTLTYSLSGTDAASFESGSTTGQITTKTGVIYDYETKKSYSVTVEVSDGNGGTASIAVTVNLTDVDETPAQEPEPEPEPANQDPSFTDGASATRSVAENSAAGTNVGSAVTATDPDASDTLTYSLSGTDATSFDIGSSTGQVTTKTGVTYDYETKKSYSVTVEVSDGNGGTASIAVTINLTDVAEATPVTTCFTKMGTLSATAEYAGAFDDAECQAHHQDSRARYFHFTLSQDATVSVSLSAGSLYVSAKGEPNNGWGTAPKGTYEHRREVRRNNGKLVHDGPRTATLSLKSGETYTVEAAADSGSFTLSITPQ